MKHIAVVPLLVGLTLVLAACGGNGAGNAGAKATTAADPAAAYAKKPVARMEKDAENAWTGLKAVHVKGTVTQKGKTVTVDMSISRSGQCRGSMAIDGEKVDVIADGKASYLKADAAFWDKEAGRSAGTLFGGKWITGFPTTSASSFCVADELFKSVDKSMSDDDSDPGKVTGSSTVDGIPAVDISGKDSDNGKPITVQVAATSPHYLLTEKEGQESISFSDFDKPVDTAAPSDAVDLRQLGQHASV